MPAGSVVVAPDGSVTKSGLAEALYDARIAMLANVEPPGVVPDGPAGFPLKNGIAVGANADASAIFTYLLANGEATGTIKMWSGAAAPSGYLLCDGSAVSRATYADLFAVCGTAFGAGNGTTTFNLPDLRGRVPLGAGTGDAADATAHTLGVASDRVRLLVMLLASFATAAAVTTAATVVPRSRAGASGRALPLRRFLVASVTKLRSTGSRSASSKSSTRI